MNTAAQEMVPAGETLPTEATPEGDNHTTALMNIIERAALDPNMDVAKLEKMLDLKERWDEKQASLLFDEAMARVQGRMQPVVADADNQQTGSRYAKLKAIVDALSPIYTAEGFSVSFGTAECSSEKLRESGWFRTTADLTHAGGFTRHFHVDLPLDVVGQKGSRNKTDIHGTKSAITYARTILMGLMFNFTTSLDVDDDGNAAGGPPVRYIDEDQAAQIRDYIAALDIDEAAYLKVLGAPSVGDIPMEKFGQAMHLIGRKRKALNK